MNFGFRWCVRCSSRYLLTRSLWAHRTMLMFTTDFALREAIGDSVLRLAFPTPTLPPATTTNHYIVGDAQAVIVDPATPDARSQEQLVAEVRRWRAPTQALLLTHHHNDHIGAATALSARLKLPIWAHQETAALLRGRLTVDRYIDDGDAVAQDHAGCWTALHTPGHAPGHLALMGPNREMVVGDLLAGQGTILIDPSDGHMGQYLASLRRLLDSEPAWLAPAHGPVLHDAAAAIEGYIQHRLAREAKVLDALQLQVEQSEDALVAKAYADTPRQLWPLATRSMRAHLLWLQEQGKARQTHPNLWRKVDESPERSSSLGG